MKKKLTTLLIAASIFSACHGQMKERVVGDGCEDCGLMLQGQPSSLTSVSTLTRESSNDAYLSIRGTIYQQDGKTPARDILLYYYHTDNKGEYKPAAEQTTGQRHGRFRGWVRTGADGKYEIHTFRPASYPNGKNPQHIHLIVKEPGTNPYWIDEILFTDDPYLTSEIKKRQTQRGGSGVVRLAKNGDKWEGKRDVVLGLNIPNY